MYWQGEVVAFLRRCKDAGWAFDESWQAAMKRHPPRGAGMGQRQLSLEDDGEPTLVDFLERVCRDAWYGQRQEQARLSPDLLERSEARTASHASL